jgi:hypothetical protein
MAASTKLFLRIVILDARVSKRFWASTERAPFAATPAFVKASVRLSVLAASPRRMRAVRWLSQPSSPRARTCCSWLSLPRPTMNWLRAEVVRPEFRFHSA